jgi:two-component system, sensor histidine kinase
MTRSDVPSYDERVLLLAPTRRDGEVTARTLAAAGVQCTVCGGLRLLAHEVERGVGAVMATDRLLSDDELPLLFQALQRQPPWSSVPVVLLCRDREKSSRLTGALALMHNVTLLDRPASMRTMVSAVQASLRGRRWQYQIRDHLSAQGAAEDALRQADRRKDEFLATLAHELRNPLAPIKTGLYLLQHHGRSEAETKRLMDMMERQLAQMVKLIDELLDVSRIATGKVMLQRERVDMRRVVDAALENNQPALDTGGHSVRVELPAHELWVVGDPLRLAQALGNLLNNAAKYTPHGGRITLRAAHSGHEVVVSVSDTGMGIPPEMVGSVFDLFAQIDRTLDRAKGGLGIGLSLVRSLVELHGGSISAQSAGIDQGSSFQIRLPAADSPPGAPAPPASGHGRAGAERYR